MLTQGPRGRAHWEETDTVFPRWDVTFPGALEAFLSSEHDKEMKKVALDSDV